MPVPWSGCWLWVGGYHGNRGCITDDSPKQKTRSAYRVAYELYKGPIGPGLCVCHTCDTPECVNPAHLWLGTTQENTADRDRKGRQWHPVGELQGGSKLTWQQVADIRADKRPASKIAESFGISQATVSRILNGIGWLVDGYQRTHKAGNTKLNAEQVKKIKLDGRSATTIAKEYGVCRETIRKIKIGRNWSKVES